MLIAVLSDIPDNIWKYRWDDPTRRRSLQALKPRWMVSQTYSPGPGLLPLRALSGRIRS